VLANLDKLVVKATNASGGYGMLVGPHATDEDQAVFAERIQANPRGYIAQPTLCLSRVPTLIDEMSSKAAMWIYAPISSTAKMFT
jgi:uncharacterized circularly permuted ATP-grasp superfamily protein